MRSVLCTLYNALLFLNLLYVSSIYSPMQQLHPKRHSCVYVCSTNDIWYAIFCQSTLECLFLEQKEKNVLNGTMLKPYGGRYFCLPIIMAGTAIPATKAIPTGAPTSVPNCHSSFFLRDQGFLPQKVQPDGLYDE